MNLSTPGILVILLFVLHLYSCNYYNHGHEDNYTKADNLYQAKKYKEAIEYLDKAIAKHPRFTKAIVLRAYSFYEIEDYSKSLTDINTALQQNPKYVAAHFGNALVKFKLKDYISAILDLNLTIANSPNHIDGHCLRGKAKLFIGDYFSALPDFEKTIQLDSTYSDAFFYKGKILLDFKQDTTGAYMYFIRAEKLGDTLATKFIDSLTEILVKTTSE